MSHRIPAFFLLAFASALWAGPPRIPIPPQRAAATVLTVRFLPADGSPAPGTLTFRCRASAVPTLPGGDSPEAAPAAISQSSSGIPCLLQFPIAPHDSSAASVQLFFQVDAIGVSGTVLRSIHGRTGPLPGQPAGAFFDIRTQF